METVIENMTDKKAIGDDDVPVDVLKRGGRRWSQNTDATAEQLWVNDQLDIQLCCIKHTLL